MIVVVVVVVVHQSQRRSCWCHEFVLPLLSLLLLLLLLLLLSSWCRRSMDCSIGWMGNVVENRIARVVCTSCAGERTDGRPNERTDNPTNSFNHERVAKETPASCSSEKQQELPPRWTACFYQSASTTTVFIYCTCVLISTAPSVHTVVVVVADVVSVLFIKGAVAVVAPLVVTILSFVCRWTPVNLSCVGRL